MEVFRLCECDNITNPYSTDCEQKLNTSLNHKKWHSVNKALKFGYPVKVKNEGTYFFTVLTKFCACGSYHTLSVV